MPKDEFSLKPLLRIAQVASTVLGIIVGLVAGPANNALAVIARAICGGFFGFAISGCFYLLLVSKNLANLHIPAKELNESEVVLLKNAGSMVHYRSGRPLRFWEAVGGSLFLTNQALEFRAHRGQPWVYRVTIQLGDITHVVPCKILGFLPGGLRVEKLDGSFELFTFGVLGNSPGWAEAILAVRDAG